MLRKNMITRCKKCGIFNDAICLDCYNKLEKTETEKIIYMGIMVLTPGHHIIAKAGKHPSLYILDAYVELCDTFDSPRMEQVVQIFSTNNEGAITEISRPLTFGKIQSGTVETFGKRQMDIIPYTIIHPSQSILAMSSSERRVKVMVIAKLDN